MLTIDRRESREWGGKCMCRTRKSTRASCGSDSHVGFSAVFSGYTCPMCLAREPRVGAHIRVRHLCVVAESSLALSGRLVALVRPVRVRCVARATFLSLAILMYTTLTPLGTERQVQGGARHCYTRPTPRTQTSVVC